MRKLFLSFTGLLRFLKAERVSQEDLDNGLFYFGCTREHVMNPGGHGEVNEVKWAFDDEEAGRVAHQMIVDAVVRAEAEGRAVFRSQEGRTNYDALNRLLESNGFSRLNPRDEYYTDFSKPAVEEQARKQALPIDVVWQ